MSMSPDTSTKEKQDKAFRVLIERPVDNAEAKSVIERAILTEESTALVKELREEGMDDNEIAALIRGNVDEA